jgi:hypothetical protein
MNAIIASFFMLQPFLEQYGMKARELPPLLLFFLGRALQVGRAKGSKLAALCGARGGAVLLFSTKRPAIADLSTRPIFW